MRQDNCFPAVEDWAQAQKLLDAPRRVKWPSRLEEVAQQVHPAHEALLGTYAARYYGTTDQSEWATDVVFGKAAGLRRLYPRLAHPGLSTLGSTDILHFLGWRILRLRFSFACN